MESNFRHLLEKHMDKTLAFQRENLGFTIYVDAEAACKVIREIERLSDSNEFYTPKAKETDIIIDAIVTGFIHGDCCPAIFFDRYEYDDDDNQLLDAKTVEEAIASVEQYLEDLKEKAEELRKEEAKDLFGLDLRSFKDKKKRASLIRGCIPYVIFGYAGDLLGRAYRLSNAKDTVNKLMDTINSLGKPNLRLITWFSVMVVLGTVL